MSGNDLRKKYLDFFASKDHLVLASYPLIPENDPTLLLVGAGMAPFKPYFTGRMKPPHTRISTSQKCVRTGDIENVGRTARHHTFFEMLGNFSFGDYFKQEAIAWAWEFVTVHLEMDPQALWVSIHTDDDEAFSIWHNEIGVPAGRIVRMDDNFWEIGAGPCGPCSEIHIDLGAERGCDSPTCGVGCNCDRYLEIWNLVFTQYDNDGDGNYTPLAKKNIDTGAGLERIASVLQGKRSNFETDLLFPIIEHVVPQTAVQYGDSLKTDISLKVIADHARSVAVMIGDGILPSNEGRGYILRRVLRRAVRHGRLLGIDKPFLAECVDVVANIFAEPYPDLMEKKDYIKRVIFQEEQRFGATLSQGMEMLLERIEGLRAAGATVLDGQAAFMLYDTFGFPWELTDEILEEHGMTLDRAGFDAAMKEQRDRARAARAEHHAKKKLPDLTDLALDDLSNDETVTNTTVVALWNNEGELLANAGDGEDISLILRVNPFYAEGGGQEGDQGMLYTDGAKMAVYNAQKLPNGLTYLSVVVQEGNLAIGESVNIRRDECRRIDTARNHTATHLLHAALKKVLGEHVNQAGSSVGPERLRFDFTQPGALNEGELERVEQFVNDAILAARPVLIRETSLEEAKQMGATALFGEKYGDTVRVVQVENVSLELCGGSHVGNSADIGLFKILSEGGIGSGIRRIEAVTGRGAHAFVREQLQILHDAAALLKTRPAELGQRIEAVLQAGREQEQMVRHLNQRLIQQDSDRLLQQAVTVGDIRVISARVEAVDVDTLRAAADALRDRVPASVILLATVIDDKVNFVAMASEAAVKSGAHAGNIVKEAAKVCGGGGGGRADMAQAGGKDPAKLTEALEKAAALTIQALSK